MKMKSGKIEIVIFLQVGKDARHGHFDRFPVDQSLSFDYR